VAASGAFPGVFEPVIADAISEHEFTDGGAVENIGLSGLRDYFHSVLPGDTRPNLVIISNASKEPSQRRVQAKWSITTMLVKAALAGSQAYERHLFADFTYDGYENWVEDLKNGGTEPVVFQSDQRRAFGVDTFGPARPVYTIVLDPTNEHILRDLTSGVVGEIRYLISVENAPLKEIELDKQDLESVPDIETLVELTESQVGATGWLGERIVEKYEEAIRRTLETIKN